MSIDMFRDMREQEGYAVFDTEESPSQDASGLVNARPGRSALERNEPCGELTVNPEGGGFANMDETPAGASPSRPVNQHLLGPGRMLG